MITLDDAGLIAGLDAGAEVMLGFPPAVAIGRDAVELIIVTRFRATVRRALRSMSESRGGRGAQLVRLEIAAMRADGIPLPAELTLLELGDGVVCFLRDLSQRREAEERLARSEALLAEAELVAGIGGFELDLHSGMFDCSPGLRRLLALPDDMEHLSLAGFLGSFVEDQRERLAAALGRTRREGTPFELQLRFLPHPDRERVLRARGALLGGGGEERRKLVGTLQDVTDEVEARSTREFLSHVVDSSNDAIYTKSIDGQITSWNRGAERLYGYSAKEAIGQPSHMLVPEGQRAAHLEMLASVFAGRSVDSMEVQRMRRDGTPVEVALSLSPVSDPAGRIVAAAVIAHDITERKRLEERLQHLADHDPLTDLLNRRRFEQLVELELERSHRYHTVGAILSIDVDNLKRVNDSSGHAAGDALIVHVAGLLRRSSRASDVVARLGGDEFAVLLPAGTGADARAAAQHLLGEIRENPVMIDGVPVKLSASIGVAPFDSSTGGVQEVISSADLAMYEAKRAGRDRVVVLSAEQAGDARAAASRSWQGRIRDALEHDAFTLYHQPVVDLASGRLAHVEVLLRMHGERGTLVPPAAFLSPAGRYGLLADIDSWVLRQTIRLLAATPQAQRVPVSVNLSGDGLARGEELIALLERELAAQGVDPRELILELSEGDVLGNLPAARRVAAELGRLGCAVAIDDFGGGIGSLRHLRHLPIQYLKLDGELVEDLCRSPLDTSVVRAVAQVANSMGARTVAESVPDEATRRVLLHEGIELGQGYHLGAPAPFSRPVSAGVG